MLSDGYTNRGPDPIGIAETAAERDVEISTIGVGGGIDENELREIAGITGGDFYHVQDADDLPDTFERVAENQTGVDLEDTNGDGIPDRVAEMDLAMPTGEPGVVGEPLNLDPIALDTSGDGIRDNETVDINYRVFQEDNETKLHASVTYAEHHPARIDTTGDGLTDREQFEGWEIEVVDDHEDAQELMAPLISDDDRATSSYFDSRSVSANPLVSDTNGDGLTDLEEHDLGTDPKRTATVADGISDVEALYRPEEDPTVFTTTPPEAHLLEFNRRLTKGNLDVEGGFSVGWDGVETPSVDVDRPGYVYEFDLLVVDSLGVDRVELQQSGVTEFAKTYPSVSPVREGDISFYAEGERVLTEFRGAETDVTTEDAVGNTGTEIVQTERSIAGRVATEYSWMDQRDLGTVSGLTHGAAEVPDFVRLLVGDPEQLAEAVTAFTEEYLAVQQDPTRSDAEFWVQVARNMGANVHRTQAQDNPEQSPTGSPTGDVTYCTDQYLDDDQPTSDYCQFAAGWYEGYTTYLVVEFLVGSKGTLKGVSSADDLRHVLDDAGDNIDTARGLRQLDGPETTTGKITYRIVTDGGTPHVDAPTVARHLRDDHGIDTAGGIKRAFDHLDEDLRHLEDLSSSEQAALAARLSKSSDPSAARAFVDELDTAGDVRRLLDQDQMTTNRMTDVYVNRGTDARQYRNIDPDLEPANILHVAEEGNIHGTNVIVKRDGDVRWLEQGTSDFGWRHIEQRHIQGVGKDAVSEDGITSFWPVGQKIEGKTLPNKMTTNEIDDLIYEAIKSGDSSGGSAIGKTEYMLTPVPQEGIERMRVVVKQDGSIETAYPETGTAVEKWNEGWI